MEKQFDLLMDLSRLELFHKRMPYEERDIITKFP
jgi:hypothetical protein